MSASNQPRDTQTLLNWVQIVSGIATTLTLLFAIFQYKAAVQPMLEAKEAEADAKKNTRELGCEMAGMIAKVNQGVLSTYYLSLARACTVNMERPIAISTDSWRKALFCMRSLNAVAFNSQSPLRFTLQTEATGFMPKTSEVHQSEMATALKWMYPDNERMIATFLDSSNLVDLERQALQIDKTSTDPALHMFMLLASTVDPKGSWFQISIPTLTKNACEQDGRLRTN